VAVLEQTPDETGRGKDEWDREEEKSRELEREREEGGRKAGRLKRREMDGSSFFNVCPLIIRLVRST